MTSCRVSKDGKFRSCRSEEHEWYHADEVEEYNKVHKFRYQGKNRNISWENRTWN